MVDIDRMYMCNIFLCGTDIYIYMSSVYAHLCCHHRNVHVFLCMCAVHRISVRE